MSENSTPQHRTRRHLAFFQADGTDLTRPDDFQFSLFPGHIPHVPRLSEELKVEQRELDICDWNVSNHDFILVADTIRSHR